MNVRIDAILQECTNKEMTKPWTLVDTEKFAKLIINKCIELGNDPPLNSYGEPKTAEEMIRSYFFS